MKKEKILKNMESYFLILAYMFIGFFIVITGTTLLPQIVNMSREGSLVPGFYSIAIMFGHVYFAYYKVFKLIHKEW